MKINEMIFRGYDIRGKVGIDLTVEIIEMIGKAHGTYLKSLGVDKAVVGHDNRISSKSYKDAVIQGLVSTGIDVIDLGLCTSPITYWAQYHFESKGSVMITGSHNPATDNGLKLGRDFSDSLTPIQEIKDLVISEKFAEGKGNITKAGLNLIDDYNKDLLSKVGQIKKFKVVVDASNSTPGMLVPALLRLAGAEVVEQNCQLDGTFPNGTPDPTEELISKRIADRVTKEKADIGFSYDSDGDRLGVVDEKGGIIWNDVLVAIFAEDAINQNPGATIVYNALCSKIVDDVIKKAGGKGIMWLTGHAFIKDKAHKEKAEFAGELSGHFYFLDKFYGHDDGSYATLRLLNYLTRKNKTLSEIVAEFPKYISSPEIKIGCPDDQKNAVVDRIIKDFQKDFEEENVITLDGARVDFPDGMMIVRCSQNGPYLTVKFEAQDKKVYDERCQYIKNILHKYPEIDWSEGVNLTELK